MNNEIGGNIPSWFWRLKSLKYLSLYSNSLYGPIPSSLGQLPILGELDLSNNLLNGTIPMSFGQLLVLKKLDLSNNLLNETIPQSLGKLSSLEVLDLSSNSLVGIFSELHCANLSRLKQFNIGSNHLSCKVKSNWIPPFRLKVINCHLVILGLNFLDGYRHILRFLSWTCQILTSLEVFQRGFKACRSPIWISQ